LLLQKLGFLLAFLPNAQDITKRNLIFFVIFYETDTALYVRDGRHRPRLGLGIVICGNRRRKR
jgi:hypothetical protein